MKYTNLPQLFHPSEQTSIRREQKAYKSVEHRLQATLWPHRSVFPGWITLEDWTPCELEIAVLSETKLRARLSRWVGLYRSQAATILYWTPSASRFVGHLAFDNRRYQVFARVIEQGPGLAIHLRPLHLHRTQSAPQLEVVR